MWTLGNPFNFISSYSTDEYEEFECCDIDDHSTFGSSLSDEDDDE